MIFGWKARRIRELERALKEAREELGLAVRHEDCLMRRCDELTQEVATEYNRYLTLKGKYDKLKAGLEKLRRV